MHVHQAGLVRRGAIAENTDKHVAWVGLDEADEGLHAVGYRSPDCLGDAGQINQVFSNLLDNAVKYLRPETPGRIVITYLEGGSDHIFSVSDNGRGIDPADQKKIFEIFRRARNTSDVRGLGLGMAYVKATLRQMGGEIWFKSKLNEGTTFTFRLPKSPPPALIRTQEGSAA